MNVQKINNLLFPFDHMITCHINMSLPKKKKQKKKKLYNNSITEQFNCFAAIRNNFFI